MNKNAHCQALLQRNKHNEQHLRIHAILINSCNQPGKTPMWGNPKKERDLLASGKLYHQQHTISNKEKTHLQHPKQSPIFFLDNCAKNVLLYELP